MAETPAHTETHESAMDYAQHEATWNLFVGLVKWGIVSVAFIVLALYAFIEGHNGLVGTLLLLLAVVVPIAGAVLSKQTKA